MYANIKETTLSELVSHIKAGHEVTLEEDGAVLAKVIPAAKPQKMYGRIGAMAGEIEMADDFDAPLTGEEAVAFGVVDEE